MCREISSSDPAKQVSKIVNFWRTGCKTAMNFSWGGGRVRRPDRGTRPQPDRNAGRSDGARRDAGADGGDRSDRREIPERMPFVCDRRTVRHVCRGLFLVSGGTGDLWRARSETGGVAAYAFAVPSENAGSHRHSRTGVPRMEGNLLSQVAFLVLSFPNSRK